MPADVRIMTNRRLLLVTRQYPAHDALYRYPFVHRRVLAYQERGVPVDVFSLSGSRELSSYVFDGVTCLTGDIETLREFIARRCYPVIAVHGLSRHMWPALAQHAEKGRRLTGWIHGSELHPLFRHDRRPDNEAVIARKEREHARNVEFWRELLARPPRGLHLVFMSSHARQDAERELGAPLPSGRIHILPNPIDTKLFSYRPKPPEQRFRILTIRPFDAAFYANDISVKVIQLLNGGEFASRLSFHVIGDGPLFEKTLAPLRGMSNVRIERRFLEQREIARLHRENGIFLVPTRMDTHGVSRDEAMSSGLVPATCPVAAVPEFTCGDCAILAPPDRPGDLAEGITDILRDPGIFAAKSRAAAKKVRATAAAGRVIPQELELLGWSGAPDRRERARNRGEAAG